MLTTNPQATIASKEQLVPRANRLVIKKNNQHVTSDSDITDTMLRLVVGILRHHKLYKLVSLTTIHDTKIYKAKKAESKKAKAAEEPKEQNVSPIRSGRGKWYMRSGD
ncbi:hypothetical protein Tco_1357079 [Tanacetum coccineum]